ncbi:MAG: HipA domain-containing protein [Bacteroidia bacterium]|nr:HipA domain-containing protein [Bacteroidia bacterium]
MVENVNRCLYCYQKLGDGENGFHSKCSKLFFELPAPPSLSLTENELNDLAKQIVSSSVTIPGVQPKLSLGIQRNSQDPKKSRLTIVGLWGEYILKPQTPRFKNLPENEDLIMHLAQLAGIETAEHTLLKIESSQLVYITKRFDRVKNKKVPMEDFCQLSGLLSADKYKSSMEKAGNIINTYVSPTAKTLDTMRFFEVALFSFLVGNSDMHLKNFSIIKNEENQYRLSPAYDLLSSNVAMPADKEQTALTLHGKKNRIRRPDFVSFGTKIGLQETVTEKILNKYNNEMLERFTEFTSISFLPDDLKEEFISLMKSRFAIL